MPLSPQSSTQIFQNYPQIIDREGSKESEHLSSRGADKAF